MDSTIAPARPSPKGLAPLAEWADEDLLLQYRQHGSHRLFEELVNRYERELYSYLRRYLGSAQMAEDAFQQTFLQVHLKCDQFEAGRKVRPWLYTVATNQAIDAQRRNRRHRMVSLDRRGATSAHSESGPLIDMLVRQEPGPVEWLEATEQRDFVRHTVDQLPEQFRQLVTLVYYQGLKYREAADVLGIPVGTVKSRLHAAIQKLNEVLTRTHLPR